MVSGASSLLLLQSNRVALPIWACFVILGIFWSRNFIRTAVRETLVTKIRIGLFGVLFLACGIITGAADLGAIAFAMSILTSVFLLNPIYCREQQQSETTSSYVGSFILLVLIFVVGLAVLPTPNFLPGQGKSEKIMTMYAIIGGIGAFTGPVVGLVLNEDESKEGDGTEDDSIGIKQETNQQDAE